MRKFIILAVSIAALAIPTAAMANVAVDNGVGFVGKGDVQSALGWNNGDFDKKVGTLIFTANAEQVTVDYPMVCMNLTTGDMSTVGHRQIVQSGTTTITATASRSACAACSGSGSRAGSSRARRRSSSCSPRSRSTAWATAWC